MTEIAESKLKEIGREAARLVAGLGTVEEVAVTVGLDSTDRPAYFFSFLIDRDRDRQRAGLTRTRLAQKLRDELIARNDAHYSFVRILSRADWGKA